MKTHIGYNWYMGRVLRHLRELKGLNQGEYAERVGKDQSAISKIESGRQCVKAKEIARFAVPLGIQGADLQELVSHCLATYKGSDSSEQRDEIIRKLCNARIRM